MYKKILKSKKFWYIKKKNSKKQKVYICIQQWDRYNG